MGFICLAWFLSVCAFDWWLSNTIKLLIMPVTAAYIWAFFGSVIYVFARWKRLGFRALLPLLIWLLSPVALAYVGPPLRRAGFERVLPAYADIIRRMDNGEIPVDTKFTRVKLTGPDARLAYAVQAHRADGVLLVTFFVGGSFPVKHWGYLYSSSGKIDPESEEAREWGWKPVHTNWFYIFD